MAYLSCGGVETTEETAVVVTVTVDGPEEAGESEAEVLGSDSIFVRGRRSAHSAPGAGHELDCEGSEAMACAECMCLVDQSCDEGTTATCLPMLTGCKLHLPFPAFTTVIATAIAS